MSELEQTPEAIDSKRLQGSLQLVATALSGTPLDTLAAAISKDDTQASRIRSGELGAKVTDVIKMLHAAGVKCVAKHKVCVDREMYEAVVTVNNRIMSDEQSVRRLMWDE